METFTIIRIPWIDSINMTIWTNSVREHYGSVALSTANFEDTGAGKNFPKLDESETV